MNSSAGDLRYRQSSVWSIFDMGDILYRRSPLHTIFDIDDLLHRQSPERWSLMQVISGKNGLWFRIFSFQVISGVDGLDDS